METCESREDKKTEFVWDQSRPRQFEEIQYIPEAQPEAQPKQVEKDEEFSLSRSDSKENNTAGQEVENIITNYRRLKQINSSAKITIVMLGRTEAGKSSLANMIANKKDLFIEDNRRIFAQASGLEAANIIWPLQDDIEILIVDTLGGFGDNRKGLDNAILLQNITTFLARLKGGFNVCLFCIQAKPRFDEYDIEELKVLGMLLGEDAFKHIWITVTHVNLLSESVRRKYYEGYSQCLPKVLEQHGLGKISENKILFADFDAFQANFLEPLHNILADTSNYIPQMAKELDVNDPNTFFKILDSAPMKKYMEHIRSMYEKEIQNYQNEMALTQKSPQMMLFQMEAQMEAQIASQILKRLELLKKDMEIIIAQPAQNWLGKKAEIFVASAKYFAGKIEKILARKSIKQTHSYGVIKGKNK